MGETTSCIAQRDFAKWFERGELRSRRREVRARTKVVQTTAPLDRKRDMAFRRDGHPAGEAKMLRREPVEVRCEYTGTA